MQLVGQFKFSYCLLVSSVVLATDRLGVIVLMGLLLTEMFSSFTMAGIWVMRVCDDDDVKAVDGVGVMVCIGEAMKQNKNACMWLNLIFQFNIL